MLGLLVSGAVTGAGGGFAVSHFVPPSEPVRPPVVAGNTSFVTLGALLVPVTIEDGTLTAYVAVEAQLEVGKEDEEGVKARLPLIIHGVNIRAYGTPLAAGPDKRLPDAATIRTIVAQEARKVLGNGVVHSVALTRLTPA